MVKERVFGHTHWPNVWLCWGQLTLSFLFKKHMSHLCQKELPFLNYVIVLSTLLSRRRLMDTCSCQSRSTTLCCTVVELPWLLFCHFWIFQNSWLMVFSPLFLKSFLVKAIRFLSVNQMPPAFLTNWKRCHNLPKK